MLPTISSIPVWLHPGRIDNLMIAAEKLAEEHDSPKIDHYWANEVKFLPEYIRKMVENVSEAPKHSVHTEDEKRRWERVKSESMILCDLLTKKFQHLASHIGDAEITEDCVVNGLFDSFNALSITNDRFKDFFRLVSSEMTFQDRLKASSVIFVKTHDKFLRRLDLARKSEDLTVMLFLLRSQDSYNKSLLMFVEFTDQYHYDHGEDNVRFLAVRMKISARVLKVKHYPTAVVMKGAKEVGRVSIAESGFLTAVFAGLKLILDDCLKEDEIDCKIDRIVMWSEEHDCSEKVAVSDGGDGGGSSGDGDSDSDSAY